ncbi:hypothetical protein NUU61_000669 [Penicillium alfredii]|uniref:Cyanovirin-N domain-containing protein n=1 Tax=Penicillium alfredii TaxID=1506179 RepID=A0A9W9GA07_9EURO|nr:uncharacterized protein NUU61_000669 [Penicillium alfredii]KAJ5114910.1 hypothetical protein NUU61_000669 [Penicillium alfredii]
MPFQPFHRSCCDITVDQFGTLRCRARRDDGTFRDASMDLNESIGNIDGYLSWAGRFFGRSAEDIKFGVEGDQGDQAMLRARVITEDGDKQDSELNLGEEIGNHNGQLYRRNWTF